MSGDDDAPVPGAYPFLVLLTLLNVMNFVDRQLLASFSNFIIPELGLTDGEFGLLTGLIFIIFYAAMGLFTGALADRVHRPRLVAAGLLLWSVLTAASGAARGFISLAIPRMFIGVGESVLTPASMSMLADRFPAKRLGFASGFYYMGVPIGVGVSLIIAGNLGPLIGWRNCFYVLGAIGVAFAGLMFFVKETPRRETVAVAAQRASGERPKLLPQLVGALKTYPSLGLTIAGGVALHFILGAAAFDQRWYAVERGFDAAWIANVSGWIFVVFGVGGNLFGGWASDAFQRVTGQGRPMFLFWVMLVLFPVNIVYRLVPGDSIWFWIGIAAGAFQLGTFYGPTFSTVQELAPARARATVVAFYILCLNLIGLGIGVTAAGFTIDWMRAEGWPEPYSATLLSFTLLSGLAIPLFLLAGLRFTKDKARLAVV
ncbi:MAG: MFS transporter [Sphingomonadaceae bacterium]|nr:MFS transporter [Sphingomonadaceae bacterium]